MTKFRNLYLSSVLVLITSLSSVQSATSIASDHDFQSNNSSINSTKSIASFSDFEKNLDRSKFSIKNFEDNNVTPPMVRAHSSFVKELGNNQFDVAPDMQRAIPALIEMNQLTYAMGRQENTKILSITSQLADQGWEIRPFKGFSGKNNRVEDVPGFVAYNKPQNQFAIVIRGSQTKDDEVKSADWEVNFDAGMLKTNNGGFHNGFYNRTNAMMDNITNQLQSFYDELSPTDRASARIVVSGHSQGAALATLVATQLTDRLKSSQLLGPDFNNLKTNTVTAYLISAPRVGDQQAREFIHDKVGKENIVRQNVVGTVLSDPVPYASPGKTLTSVIKKIPVVGNKLASTFGGNGGAASVGYLAADLSKNVLSRNIKAEDQALRERVKNRFSLNNAELANLIDNKPANFFKALAPAQTKKTLNRVFVDNLKDTVSTYLAPLHYGGTANQFKEGAFFQPNAVAGYNANSPQLSQLLNQGAVTKSNSFDQKVKLFFKF